MQSHDHESDEPEPDENEVPLTTEEQAVLVAINPENEMLYRKSPKNNADDNNNEEEKEQPDEV